VRVAEVEIDTRGLRVVDITDEVERFVAGTGASGLVHVFVPHATAGVAVMETGSGSEGDLEEALERILPRDDRYTHRHGSVGHGGDHRDLHSFPTRRSSDLHGDARASLCLNIGTLRTPDGMMRDD